MSLLTLTRQFPGAVRTTGTVQAPYCWVVRTGGQEFFIGHEDQSKLFSALNIPFGTDPGPAVGDYCKIRVDARRERLIAYGPTKLWRLSLTRLQTAAVLQ